nr:iron-containing alcohol dehydrogenase [Lachnospiraceae bacterium]
DYEAMSEIMWSGSISHVGITGIGSRGDTGRDGDWGVHQLGMAISAIFDSTHGATLTAVWGSWARYCCSENCSRFAQLGRNVFGVTEADDAKAAEMAICKVEEFFKTLGMPLSLHELLEREVTDDDIEAISQECSYGKSRKIGTFKVLDYDDIKKIYIMAR